MNREIKFRAWDSVHNKMIYLKDVVSCGYDNEFDVYELYFEENNLKCRGYDDFDDDFGGTIVNETELPIMEYTGLKDKNGVEIYEGDSVKCKLINQVRKNNHWINEEIYENFEVIYSNEDLGFRFKDKSKIIWNFENCELEVIGNVYENKAEEVKNE